MSRVPHSSPRPGRPLFRFLVALAVLAATVMLVFWAAGAWTLLVGVLEEGRPLARRTDGAADVPPGAAETDDAETPMPPAARVVLKQLTNGAGMKMALIPAGTFKMGSPDGEPRREQDEGPVRDVEITRPFFLGVFEVTQEEFEKVTGRNPSHFKDLEGVDTRRFPADGVSYAMAVEFCRALSEMPEEKKAGRVYRLPTEAEWEYACRAGGSDLMPFYFERPRRSASSARANFDGRHPYGGAAKGERLRRPVPVGSYPPNAFGLHDMHGNVWEWCADWYGIPTGVPEKDPRGPEKGMTRVMRGGSWFNGAEFCRAAYRHRMTPATRTNLFGLRIALTVPEGFRE